MVQSLTNKTSTETQYIYDYTEKNPTVLSEIKNNGVTIDYAYGCDNKKTDVTVDTNILYKKTHETYSVSTDIIGSTRWAFDSIGNVCASTEYDAWGNVTENSGLTVNASVPTVNITKSYTGHIYDEGTGFWNAGAREYDPFTKRFTSMDPENGNIYVPDTLHKYSYASNNPIMNVDLNGRFTTSTFEKAACSAVKAAIGGIYTFTKTTVNVWNDFNNLIDRIPAPVKAAVAIAGTGVAIASGVAPGAAVLTMAMAMGEGAAVNLAFYAAGSYVSGKQMTWKDAIKTAGKGALDGAFLNGIGQSIAGVGRILVNNKAGIKNFYVDETGSVKIDGVSGGKSGSKTHVPSTNTQVVQHPEIKSHNQVKMSDVTNYWDDYLGSNQTNIHPRTGLVDNDRIFSADGTRSIRFGNHEMNSMDTTKFHFHQEEWKYDSVNDVMEYFNTLIRIKK